MIIIAKTSATRIKDGFYTALLRDLKISGNKVCFPYYKQVDSYLEYTNINKDELSRLKSVYQSSNDIITYTVKENEIIGVSYSDISKKKTGKKSISKRLKPDFAKKRKETVSQLKKEKKESLDLDPKIFTDKPVKKKRKRILSILINSDDIIFEDGFISLILESNQHKCLFPESKSLYQVLNIKYCRYIIEVKLKGGEIFNRKTFLDYIEGLISGELYNYKSGLPDPKEQVSLKREKNKLLSKEYNLNNSTNEIKNSSTDDNKDAKKVESINHAIISKIPTEKQSDVISLKEDNDWNKIRFQKGMVQLNYSSSLYRFVCIKAKQEYDYIKSFYQTHHYQYTINLRNNIPVGVSIPDKLFEFLELGNIIHQMKKSKDMRDLWKVRKLTDGLSNRAVDVLKFFNKDKTYYFTKLSERHNEDYKIRVVWEPNIWSGSAYDIHLTFLFTYFHNSRYYLIWESTEISTATYIFKFTSLEKYNLGVEHFVSCISDINCYKGRLALRRGNKYLENVKFISHSSELSKSTDYEWNIKLKKAVMQ
jgi:hypothetical protein